MLSLILVTVSHGGGGRCGSGERGVFYYGEDPKGMAGRGGGGAGGGRETVGDKRVLDETPLMASDHFNAPIRRIHAPGTTKDGKNMTNYNSLFFTPQHYDQDESSHSNPTPTIDANDSKTASALHRSIDNEPFDGMPPPAPLTNHHTKPTTKHPKTARSIVISHTKPKPSTSPDRTRLIEYVAIDKSHTSTQKHIVPLNTRLPYQNESRIIEQSPATLSTPDPDRSTRPPSYGTDTDATTDLDASPRPVSTERAARIRASNYERDTYVAMTPLIVPGGTGTDRGEEESPIVTWGRVASTPLVLGGGHATPIEKGGFLGGSDAGEDRARIAGRRLAKRSRLCTVPDNASVRRRASANRTHGASLGRTAEALTPAARSLLEKCNSSSSTDGSSSSRLSSAARSRAGFGSAFRSSYTPKALSSSSGRRSRSGRKGNVHRATPLLSPKAEGGGSSEERSVVSKAVEWSTNGDGGGGKRCEDLTGGLLRL